MILSPIFVMLSGIGAVSRQLPVESEQNLASQCMSITLLTCIDMNHLDCFKVAQVWTNLD